MINNTITKRKNKPRTTKNISISKEKYGRLIHFCNETKLSFKPVIEKIISDFLDSHTDCKKFANWWIDGIEQRNINE